MAVDYHLTGLGNNKNTINFANYHKIIIWIRIHYYEEKKELFIGVDFCYIFSRLANEMKIQSKIFGFNSG